MRRGKPIELLLLADQSPAEVNGLGRALSECFRVPCSTRKDTLDPSFAYDPKRNQFHSTAILASMQPLSNGNRILAVTGFDLFVPVLTFVFGEAQLAGNCAVVSLHRLREEVYGLPPNSSLQAERLRKEAVHELGHTFGLRHCDNWRCVMTSSHSVEWLDVKTREFCASCRKVISLGS